MKFPCHSLTIVLAIAAVAGIFATGNGCKCGGKKTIELAEYTKELENGANSDVAKPELVISAKEAKILSNEPDSLITCVEAGTYQIYDTHMAHTADKCLVVKDVFANSYFANAKIDVKRKAEMRRKWDLMASASMAVVPEKVAKPMFLLAHELDIFKLFEDGKGQKNPVARLYKGLKRQNSLMFVMELGKPLTVHLADLQRKWTDDFEGIERTEQNNVLILKQRRNVQQINAEIEGLIVEIAITLDAFHEKALHLHLKPGNWVYGQKNADTSGEGNAADDDSKTVLKLIDFQTALPINRDNSEPIEHFIEFACNSLWNEKGLAERSGAMMANQRPSTYASPQHKWACELAKMVNEKEKNAETRDAIFQEALKMITVKSDIWSMGVLIVEILAQTPVLLEDAKVISKRTKILGMGKSEHDQMIAETLVELRAHFAKDSLNMSHVRQQKLAEHMGRKVETNFPRIYKCLKSIFKASQEERPTLPEIIALFSQNDENAKQ